MAIASGGARDLSLIARVLTNPNHVKIEQRLISISGHSVSWEENPRPQLDSTSQVSKSFGDALRAKSLQPWAKWLPPLMAKSLHPSRQHQKMAATRRPILTRTRKIEQQGLQKGLQKGFAKGFAKRF